MFRLYCFFAYGKTTLTHGHRSFFLFQRLQRKIRTPLWCQLILETTEEHPRASTADAYKLLMLRFYRFSVNGGKTWTPGRTPRHAWLLSNLQGAWVELKLSFSRLHTCSQVASRRSRHIRHALKRPLATKRVELLQEDLHSPFKCKNSYAHRIET